MDPTPRSRTPAQRDPTDRTKVLLFVLAALLAVAVVVLTGVLVLRDGDGVGAAPAPQASPTPTSPPLTSPLPSSSTAPATSTPPSITGEESRRVVWPKPGTKTTYDVPVDAAEGLATGLVGFADPVVGEFRQGDSRSGEVDIRPRTTGPATTVLVRQLSDGHWYAIGASSDDLRLARPTSGTTITSPLAVKGLSRAFEGAILVSVHAQGDPEPLARRPLIGGSSELGPFSGTLTFDAPDDDTGAIMITTESAEDGRIWQATVVPVQLARG